MDVQEQELSHLHHICLSVHIRSALGERCMSACGALCKSDAINKNANWIRSLHLMSETWQLFGFKCFVSTDYIKIVLIWCFWAQFLSLRVMKTLRHRVVNHENQLALLVNWRAALSEKNCLKWMRWCLEAGELFKAIFITCVCKRESLEVCVWTNLEQNNGRLIVYPWKSPL